VTDPVNTATAVAWLPDLLYTGTRFEKGVALVCEPSGRITSLVAADKLRGEKLVRLPNRAMLPGMANAHSHAFQRVLRGRTEYRWQKAGASPLPDHEVTPDSFWTWREMMYSAAARLTPEDLYDAAAMAFLEMALSGITAVGEFHYLHHAPDGAVYDDPNLLAKEVVRAAHDVGLRIALLRAAYARSGFQTEPNPRQARFIETKADTYLSNLERLIVDLGQTESGGKPRSRPANCLQSVDSPGLHLPTAWAGVAPHSVRAVPVDYLREVVAYASQHDLKVHMHVAEQPAEVSACIEEYGRTPVALLETEGLLSERFTAVHAIHVTPKAVPALAPSGASVCACPTTERNLGDGVIPAAEFFKHGVPVCLGSDSNAQIDLLEDARELEYHLRLQKLERAVLAPAVTDRDNNRDDVESALAARLFDCATTNGAQSIGAPGGQLAPGCPADFFTIDLNDPSVAGAGEHDLLSSIVFSLSRAAVREVVVGGKPIVSEGRHLVQEEIVERFNELQQRLWGR
jgi:formimidoylglutamate deiminase